MCKNAWQIVPLFVLVTMTSICNVHAELVPKMVADLVPANRRLVEEVPKQETISAVFMETCKPDGSLVFPLSAGEGKGFIGLMDNTEAEIHVTLSGVEGTVELDITKQSNVFSAINNDNDDGTVAMRFTYTDIPDMGGEMILQCSQDVTLVIAYKDHNDFSLQYEVTTTAAANDKTKATSSLALLNTRALKNLQAQAVAKLKPGQVRRLNSSNKRVNIHDETPQGLVFDSDGKEDIIVVQVELEESGKKMYRSIVASTHLPPPDVGTMQLESATVDDSTGDLRLYFSGMPTGDTLLLKAAIQVEVHEQILGESIHLQAMTKDGHLTLHGGWIRKVLDSHFDDENKGSTNGWKIIVSEAVALDPEASYAKVAEMQKKQDSAIIKNKQLLSNKPSAEEKQISDDMKQGRRPSGKDRRLRPREMQSNADKKLLVHGYCSTGNQFPTSQFQNAMAFADPSNTSGSNNWSHDEFAQKIGNFAENNGITGCGIIAHSQGGAASLHLYTYYWSCLDYPQYSGRMIQSVGTPYQGTALAATLAELGEVFGVGCGTQNDLTYSGAATWLAGIPSWARSKVYYWTTSFEDNLWSYDYCQFVTDPFLSDPDDGVTEKAKGQLSGANNRGHKEGWCHTFDMDDPPQYNDSGRNSEMNTNAQW